MPRPARCRTQAPGAHPETRSSPAMTLLVEQFLNGVQLSATLFLVAAGLTLIFGVMGLINLAHGSLYMAGAYCGAAAASSSGSFLLGLLARYAAAPRSALSSKCWSSGGSTAAIRSIRCWRRLPWC